MKPGGKIKHFVLAFVLALGCYALLYSGIEHQRTRKGPWQVMFTNNTAGVPAIIIDQPKLAITGVQINFLEEPTPPTTSLGTLVFQQPQQVPYPVPFGQCIFMDTTFLPGTVTFRLFGHEIKLLPRVLIIDHQEHPWLPHNTIQLHPPERPASVHPAR